MRIRELSKPYAAPLNGVAVFHLVVTIILYFGAITLGTIYWGNLPVQALATVIFLGGAVRFFAIQHDCGHLSYFSNRDINEYCGIVLGTFTGNPYYAMRYNHNRHHAYIGNLDERDSHEVLTWTVAEYQAATPTQQFLYRVYRSAFVLYLVGPIFIIFLRYRYPKNAAKTGMTDIVTQNALMFLFWAVLAFGVSWNCIAFFLFANAFTACFGVFMVYAGHNYEDAYWENHDDCDFEDASLKGSSVLDFGRIFHFLTFNFAFHDLHHVHAKIPCYRLRDCHVALKDELQPTRMGFLEAVSCVQWKLWDPEQGKMVRFSDLHHRVQIQPAE